MNIFLGLTTIFSNGLPINENYKEYKDSTEFHSLESGKKTTLRKHYDATQKIAEAYNTVSKGNGATELKVPKGNSNSIPKTNEEKSKRESERERD